MAYRAIYVCLLLVSPASVHCGRCVAHLYEDGYPVTRLIPKSPVIFPKASQACFDASSALLYNIENWGDREKDACDGEELVPLEFSDYEHPPETNELLMSLKDDTDEPANKSVDPAGMSAFGVVNLTTGRWHYGTYYHKFTCILCQRNVIMMLPAENIKDGDPSRKFTTLKRFLVNVTSIKPRESDTVNDDEINAVRSALTELLEPKWDVPVKPKYHHSVLEGDKIQLEFRVYARVLKTVVESTEVVTILGEYVVSFSVADACPLDQTIDVDGGVLVWPPTMATLDYGVLGGLFLKLKESGLIPRRDCIFNKTSYRAAWSEVSYWRPAWEPCSDEQEYANEDSYKEILGEEVMNRHIHQLQRYTDGPINATTLREVTTIVNRQIDLFDTVGPIMTRDLVNITSNLLLDDGKDACLVQDTRAYVIVSDLLSEKPVIGLTLQFRSGSDAGNINISLDRIQMAKPLPNQQFSLAISNNLVKDHKRMALLVYWISIPEERWSVFGEKRTTQYLEVTVALVLSSEQKEGLLQYALYPDYYVDVSLKPHSDRVLSVKTVMLCTAWNRDVGQWLTEGCRPLKSNRGDLTVCRCSAKYFALDTGVPGVATAKFALNKEYTMHFTTPPLISFIMDSTPLIVATIVECLLSAMGLGSILCTAIFFKEWRKNIGHKILLEMVLALTVNLVLGFTTNFVHLNTESAGCVVLGVLRHYTFLAMFLWMLVLSGLQMKRLMTVAGAKAFTHLILKASLFAWGVPLIPITVLLAWNVRFYQTDRFDRGYCYPEGPAFQVTVQAPAGLILLVNLAIFLAILTHIFDCWGKKITRHSKNKRAEQLNKLKTSLFIFFLFGFTWVFHFLSEERVISSQFLFEYLFLMTATMHIFVLALFFVVLQENTRQAWLVWIKKLTPGDGSKGPTPPKNVPGRPAPYRPQPAKKIVPRVKKPKAKVAVTIPGSQTAVNCTQNETPTTT